MTMLFWWIALLGCDLSVTDDDTGGGGGDRDDSGQTDADTDTSDTDTSDTDTDTDTSDTDTDVVSDCTPSSDALIIDLSDSSLLVEPTPSGFTHDLTSGTAAIAPRVMLEPPNSSGTTAWDVSPGPPQTLTPGAHSYSAVNFATGTNTVWSEARVDGDLTLDVAGDFIMGMNSQLRVRGALVLRVGGKIDLAYGQIYASSIEVHHSGSEPIALGHEGTNDGSYVCSMTQNTAWQNTSSGSNGGVTVYSRGGLLLGDDTYIWSQDVNATAADDTPSGDVTLLSYGDITLGSDAYIWPGESAKGVTGDVWVLSEGEFRLGDSAYVMQVSSTRDNGNIALHAVDGFTALSDSYVMGALGTEIDLRTEGAMDLSGSIYATSNGADVSPTVIRSRSLYLHGDAYLTGAENESGAGGDLLIDVLGNATFGGTTEAEGQADVYGGYSVCADAGDIVIRASGDVSVAYGSLEAGGVDQSSCAGVGEKGAIDIIAGGDLTEDTVLGSGIVAWGIPDDRQESNADVLPAAPELDVWRWGTFTLPGTQTCRTQLASVDITSPTGEVQVQVRQPGTHWVNAADLVGTELADGWEARLALKQRLFDGASSGGATLTFQ